MIREYGADIRSIAAKYKLDPLLLAGVVFSENRNDGNWIWGEDQSGIFTLGLFGVPEVKNLLGPLKTNPSAGMTEVSVAVAELMDHPELVPENYGELPYEERVALHEQVARDMSYEERQRILLNLSHPKKSLEYSAQYLAFLGSYRDYGDDYALWLTDYNRGLSDYPTTLPYGRNFDTYRQNIEYVLNWSVDDLGAICSGGAICVGVDMDRALYGELP